MSPITWINFICHRETLLSWTWLRQVRWPNWLLYLTERGHKVYYFDHHLENAGLTELESLRSLLGDRLIMRPRSQATSCVQLITAGFWKELNIETVFFDSDMDGFLSHLKGLGLTYPEMDGDACYLDGPRHGNGLSQTGRLITNIISVLTPYYYYDRTGYLQMKKWLFRAITKWLKNGLTKPVLSPENMELLRQKAEENEKRAQHLAQQTDLLAGGIAFANFIPQLAMGFKPNVAIWKRGVGDRLTEAGQETVLFCRKVVGHLGRQICIEIVYRFQDEIDLRNYMPAGSVGHASFRIHVPENKWPEFLANWRGENS